LTSPRAPDDGALEPGALVGDFVVEAPIGVGGMGTVYAGVHPTIGKRVAIKVLRRALADDPSWLTRFQREARAANEVNHPGIVDVFAFGQLEDGRPYLVMSLLEGRSLRETLVGEGRLSPDEAWRITRAIAEALAAAHARGIVHRDLKPDNVFLEDVSGRPSTPRVLDFGIAKLPVAEDGSADRLTQSGVILGTPAYMAPEQWWGKGVDARADQYALGGVLFHMLTGAPPFGDEGFVELLQKHLHTPAPTLASKGVAASDELEALVARLLAKDPTARFGTLDEIVVAGDGVFGRPTSAPVALPTPVLRSAGGSRAAAATPAILALGEGATELAPTPVLAAAPRRLPYFAFVAALLVATLGGQLAVGYAGPDAHDVLEWFHIGGFGTYVGAAWFVVALGLTLRAGRLRGPGVPWSRLAVSLSLLPAVSALLSTHSGSARAREGLLALEPTWRFAVLHAARYEANANRFLGYAMTGMLCLALAALPGLAAPGPGATLRARRLLTGALATVFVLFGVSLAAGAPSAALALGAALFALSLGLFFPLSPAAPRALAWERALLSALGTSLFAAVGLSRIEAREAALWNGSLTRAERVVELIGSSAERNATMPLVAAAVLGVVALGWLETRAHRAGSAPERPSRGARVLVTIVALLTLVDLGWYLLFIQDRAELRQVMSSRFALFAELDPPPADAALLDDHPPKAGPALQIARTWVAIDGERTTKLLALESEVGVQNLARDLGRALARAEGEKGPELSVSIDRTVPSLIATKVLRIAHDAGAREVELLFTRGAPPLIPAGAPAEASHVVTEDFVALPVRLGGAGLELGETGTFADAAPRLQRAAREDGPLPLRVTGGSPGPLVP
jgi:tRNA A-37 threonylcarbamoyl transferase component Bud32